MWQKIRYFIFLALFFSLVITPVVAKEQKEDSYYQGSIIERSTIVTEVSKESGEENTSAKVNKSAASQKSLWQKTQDVVNNVTSSIRDTISEGIIAAKNAVTSLAKNTTQVALNFGKGIVSGVRGVVQTGINNVRNFFNSVTQTVQNIGATLKTVKSVTTFIAKFAYNWKFGPKPCASYSVEKANENIPANDDSITVFVNGILNNHDDYNCGLQEVRQAFPKGKMVEMYNPTAIELSVLKMLGMPADVKQSANDIFEGVFGVRLFNDENKTVDELYEFIKANQGHPMTLVGHSQGTAILSAALRKAKDNGADLSKITVYTFANVAVDYPEGPTYYHCLHYKDTITMPFLNPLKYTSKDDQESHIKEINGPNSKYDFLSKTVDNHDLTTYLEDFKNGKCAN